jgi:hypothetical protein
MLSKGLTTTTTTRMIMAVIVAAMVFKEDGEKVLDLIGRDKLTESKATSDLGLIGLMADELEASDGMLPIGMIADVLKAGCDEKGLEITSSCDESKANCGEIKDKDKEEIDFMDYDMKLIDKMIVVRMSGLCDGL